MGITLPTNGRNLCDVPQCTNNGCTAVNMPGYGQFNVCGYHLKDKLESGAWILPNIKII